MKYLHKIGNLLCILSIIFIGRYLYLKFNEIDAISLQKCFNLIFLLKIMVILVPIFLLCVLIWQFILKSNGQYLSYHNSFIILSLSNINKYLPGNIFQYASRGLFAYKYGVPVAISTISIIQETLIVVISGCMIGCTGLLMFGHSPVSPYLLLIVIFFGLFAVHPRILNILTMLVVKITGKVHNPFPAENKSRYLFYAFIFTFLIFIFWGIAFSVLLSALDHDATNILIISIFAFSLSWVAGFVTPGAPAGIGVREAALILLLQNTVSPAVAVTAAGLLRIITTTAEILFFLVGYLLKSLD